MCVCVCGAKFKKRNKLNNTLRCDHQQQQRARVREKTPDEMLNCCLRFFPIHNKSIKVIDFKQNIYINSSVFV